MLHALAAALALRATATVGTSQIDDAAAVALTRPQELLVAGDVVSSHRAALLKPVDAFYGFWVNGSPRLLAAALSPRFFDHTLPPGRPQGPAGPAAASKTFLTAVPDLRVAVMQRIVVGDRVVSHLRFTGHFTGSFQGVMGRGQPIDFIATDILKVRDGKITDNWHLEDNLTFLKQIGLVNSSCAMRRPGLRSSTGRKHQAALAERREATYFTVRARAAMFEAQKPPRRTLQMSRVAGVKRHSFLSAAAAGVAAGSLGILGSAERCNAMTEITQRAPTVDPTAVRPFRVSFPEADLVDLRRRIAATRWPDRETVADDSQGVPLATIQTLMRVWGTDYDWRACETRLNALPQFITEIDGLDIHFIHVRSKHADAMPLVVTHGWPGSVIEQLKIIEPLTNPTAYGANASDAFHLVIPSLPGYGFSAKPTATGWDPARIARAWVVLMKRLGYAKFAAQGGDWGGAVVNTMAQQAPPELLGIHTNFPATIPADILRSLNVGDPPPASLSVDERRAYGELAALYAKKRAYAAFMGTRPQTLYGLSDSPVDLAAWMVDHGDGWAQPAAAVTSAILGRTVNGHPAGALTLNDLLDDITLYWLTNTGVSSSRLYWETHFNLYAAIAVSVPAAITVFPGENYQAPRSWTERSYRNLIYFHEVDRGGHYAAWEQPQLFSEEVRAGLRSLRSSGQPSSRTVCRASRAADGGSESARYARQKGSTVMPMT